MGRLPINTGRKIEVNQGRGTTHSKRGPKNAKKEKSILT